VVWRVGLAVVVALAIGAGVVASVSHVRHSSHNETCAAYARALEAATATPGVYAARSSLDVLSPQDRQEVTASDDVWDNTSGRGEEVSITSWDEWVKSFKAQALAARGCGGS